MCSFHHFSPMAKPMTESSAVATTMMESSNVPDDEISVLNLKKFLEEARRELSDAREKIAKLEAENAELRSQAEQLGGNKNGQADEKKDGRIASAGDIGADADNQMETNADGNEEKKEDEASGNVGRTSGITDPEEANAADNAQHINEEEDKNNAQAQDTDETIGKNIAENADIKSENKSDIDESDSDDDEEEEEEEEEEDQDEEQQEPPTSPADDIRLRAARTLIWADSAIKRAEALKEQQQQQQGGTPMNGSVRGSVVSGDTPSRMGTSGGGGNHSKPPSTVRIVQSAEADSQADSDDDDASFLSDDESNGNNDDSYSTNSQSGKRRRGPLARIGQFLEDKMDDVADRLVAMDTTLDNRSLHSGSLGGGAAGGGLPPRSPPGNYKYCNDAMKKKMGGDDDESAKTPISVRSGGDGDGTAGGSESKPKPMMNEAMMRLSSEKKKRTGFGSRLFSG